MINLVILDFCFILWVWVLPAFKIVYLFLSEGCLVDREIVIDLQVRQVVY